MLDQAVEPGPAAALDEDDVAGTDDRRRARKDGGRVCEAQDALRVEAGADRPVRGRPRELADGDEDVDAGRGGLAPDALVLDPRRDAELEHVAQDEDAPGVAVQTGEDSHAGARGLRIRVVGVVEEAHAFINYMMDPQVAARNSNFISYANGNLASQKFIDKAVLEDRSVYPDAETMKSLYIITAHDQKTQRLLNRLWTRVKTGR